MESARCSAGSSSWSGCSASADSDACSRRPRSAAISTRSRPSPPSSLIGPHPHRACTISLGHQNHRSQPNLRAIRTEMRRAGFGTGDARPPPSRAGMASSLRCWLARSVVRVSILNIPHEHLDEASRRMKDAEASLSGIRDLPGLLAYFVGVDRTTSQLSNVSVWDTAENAKAMSTFQPMLDLAATFSELPGVTFVRPIPNFEGLWQWGDASGGAASTTG